MTHTDHLARAADGLRLLAAPDDHPWPEVARTAAAVPRHIHQATQDNDRWAELPPVDQVALIVAVVEGHLIEDHARYGPANAQGRAHLVRLAAECAALAHRCDTSGHPWPQADPERPQHLHRAVDHLTAYQALAPIWQAHVLDTLTHPGEITWRLTRALLRDAGPASAPAEVERPQLSETLAEALTHITDQAPETTRLGRDLVQRLDHLPEAWQLHVMRRLDDKATPLDAISETVLARNIARNRFGITDPATATSGTPAP